MLRCNHLPDMIHWETEHTWRKINLKLDRKIHESFLYKTPYVELGLISTKVIFAILRINRIKAAQVDMLGFSVKQIT